MSHKRLILIISLLLPVAVSGLYFMPKFSLDTVDFLPLFNACVNGSVFLILISQIFFYKNHLVRFLKLVKLNLDEF